MIFTPRSLSSDTNATVIIPTQSLQATARQFSQRHGAVAERIYHNTLAVGVVAQYLRLLGINTDVTQGDSWNPVLHAVNDVADLYLPDHGRLECRVVEADQSECYVPADVSCDRIAYIIVQLTLDLPQPEAALLGFSPTVAQEWISIHDLSDLSELPHYLTDTLTDKATVI